MAFGTQMRASHKGQIAKAKVFLHPRYLNHPFITFESELSPRRTMSIRAIFTLLHSGTVREKGRRKTQLNIARYRCKTIYVENRDSTTATLTFILVLHSDSEDGDCAPHSIK